MKAQNRTFVISGGSSGLGFATTRALLDAGAFVSILDLQENAELCGERIKVFKIDITKEVDLEAAVESTVAWTRETGAILGGVVNCAGTARAAKIIDASGNPHPLDQWNFTIAVNATATFNLTRLVCKHLVSVPPEGPDNERGIVILVSSFAAFEGQTGMAAYAASKGALISAVQPLAHDLSQYGVRVNAIAPGAFISAMSNQMTRKAKANVMQGIGYPRRFGYATEFAQTVRWMIECVYLNGETVKLNAALRLSGRL